MSTTRVQFTKRLQGDKLYVEAQIIASEINRFVFYFKNIGGPDLGPFQGVVDAQQLTRMPRWTGAEMPTFGVPFVRSDIGFRTLDSEEDVRQWISLISKDIEALVLEIASTEPVVTTYDITI